jgi:tetratricopeptide (TPR) repeat protein
VEDHAAPIAELRRLVAIWTAWEAARRANKFYERKDYGSAVAAMRTVLESREDALALYNLACYESLDGRADDALGHLRRAIELDPSYRRLAENDSDFDPIRERVSEL